MIGPQALSYYSNYWGAAPIVKARLVLYVLGLCPNTSNYYWACGPIVIGYVMGRSPITIKPYWPAGPVDIG